MRSPHGPGLVDEGLAEIALHGLGDEDPELLGERLVEAVGRGEIPLRLGGERVRPLRHRIERTPRRGVHHQEGDERHREQGRDQPQEAVDDVAEQCTP